MGQEIPNYDELLLLITRAFFINANYDPCPQPEAGGESSTLCSAPNACSSNTSWMRPRHMIRTAWPVTRRHSAPTTTRALASQCPSDSAGNCLYEDISVNCSGICFGSCRAGYFDLKRQDFLGRRARLLFSYLALPIGWFLDYDVVFSNVTKNYLYANVRSHSLRNRTIHKLSIAGEQRTLELGKEPILEPFSAHWP